MNTLFTNISELVCVSTDPSEVWKKGLSMRNAGIISDAYLLVKDDKISGFGPMSEVSHDGSANTVIDCSEKVVLPGWVDSHTHLIFPAMREYEFVQRLQGISYEEIAQAGGGILNSAKRTQSTDENTLFESGKARLEEVIRLGTTTLEIKSGYGLTVEGELKLLRVANRLKAISPIPIVVTLLAAHALPLAYKQNRESYIQLVINETLPLVASEGLADYVDVFCETGFFTPEETLRILEAGKSLGLKGRLHANELANSGGVQAAVRAGAHSADHLECIGADELLCLANSDVVPTLLPSTAFFLGIPYAPAREMIDYGLGIALASDYNPGTSPSGNMNFVVSLACIQCKLLPCEAIVAATLNAAHSLRMAATIGSLAVGKQANFMITEPIGNHLRIPYNFGRPVIESVYINGKRFHGL